MMGVNFSRRKSRRLLLLTLSIIFITCVFYVSTSSPFNFLYSGKLTQADLVDQSRDGLDKALAKLGLRPMGWRGISGNSPVSQTVINANYIHQEKVRGFASRKLTESMINSYDPSTFDCDQIKCESKDSREMLHVTHAVPMRDPTGFDDLWEYLRSSGYEKLIGTEGREHWYVFSESAVWMPGDNCYISVSRYIYAPKAMDHPVLSLCRLQAFDSDWNEILGKRIRYVDVTQMKARAALQQYLLERSNKHPSLDQISLQLPQFMHIEIERVPGWDAIYLGPEDPKITYRENKLIDDEPIVTFNMLTESKDRLIHAAFPLRTPTKDGQVILKALKYSGSDKVPMVEKNWSPFFEQGDSEFTAKSLGSAHFIYNLGKMQMIRCNFDTGTCKRSSRDPEKERLADKTTDGDGAANVDGKLVVTTSDQHVYLRGGTNVVAFPQALKDEIFGTIRKSGKSVEPEIWFGIAKTHDEACSCGKATYRPNAFILYKKHGLYRLEMMTESSELGMKIMPWSGGLEEQCDGLPNVLSPNSIAFWDVEKTELGISDCMALTFSISDKDDELIFVKGMANYIKRMYYENSIEKDDSMPGDRAEIVRMCAMRASTESCERYVKLHPQVSQQDN